MSRPQDLLTNALLCITRRHSRNGFESADEQQQYKSNSAREAHQQQHNTCNTTPLKDPGNKISLTKYKKNTHTHNKGTRARACGKSRVGQSVTLSAFSLLVDRATAVQTACHVNVCCGLPSWPGMRARKVFQSQTTTIWRNCMRCRQSNSRAEWC